MIRLALERWANNNGINDMPDRYSDGIHSWRCQYPDKYSPCDCFKKALDELEEMVSETYAQLLESRAEKEAPNAKEALRFMAQAIRESTTATTEQDTGS